MNLGTIWGIAKIAATRIPWGKVMQNIPAMADLAGRTKERLAASGASRGAVEDQLSLLQEENRKLEKALAESSNHLQQTVKSLKVVAARQKMLMAGTVLSFLMALVSLVISLR